MGFCLYLVKANVFSPVGYSIRYDFDDFLKVFYTSFVFFLLTHLKTMWFDIYVYVIVFYYLIFEKSIIWFSVKLCAARFILVIRAENVFSVTMRRRQKMTVDFGEKRFAVHPFSGSCWSITYVSFRRVSYCTFPDVFGAWAWTCRISQLLHSADSFYTQ